MTPIAQWIQEKTTRTFVLVFLLACVLKDQVESYMVDKTFSFPPGN